MQIVFHIGAHCTDEGQVYRCLAKNKAMLAEQGIIAPPPRRFRPILRETLSVLKGDVANAEVQEIMLSSILTDESPERLIFSNDGFICGTQRILDRGTMYPDVGEKCLKLHNLFADHDVEFAIAIRNPATLLPACFNRLEGGSFAEYIAQIDPMHLRWSSVIERIREALPDVPLKVWSNEDSPFIWYELIRELADLTPTTALDGLDDYLATIMLEEGLERMDSYITTHPPANEIQRRRILSAFLDKFEIEDKSLDVTARVWSDDDVEALTDIYEEDLFTIERLPGVQFISP